jgi:2-hydroxy-3-oxopropionate reductase
MVAGDQRREQAVGRARREPRRAGDLAQRRLVRAGDDLEQEARRIGRSRRHLPRPVFDELGAATTHIGPPGAGQVCKAANQVVVALTLTLARQAGVDPARVREALLGGFAQSRILEVHGQRMLDRAFDPGFGSSCTARTSASRCRRRGRRAPLLAAAPVAGLFDALIAQGDGGRDHSALITLYEQQAEPPRG